jgi:hypothetical protein
MLGRVLFSKLTYTVYHDILTYVFAFSWITGQLTSAVRISRNFHFFSYNPTHAGCISQLIPLFFFSLQMCCEFSRSTDADVFRSSMITTADCNLFIGNQQHIHYELPSIYTCSPTSRIEADPKAEKFESGTRGILIIIFIHCTCTIYIRVYSSIIVHRHIRDNDESCNLHRFVNRMYEPSHIGHKFDEY